MSLALVGGRRPRGTGVMPMSAMEVVADGIWTWFTVPEAVQVAGYVYAGSVSSDGRCRAHRIDASTGTTLTFDLSGVLEIDDHNNASVLPLADGRVVFFYGTHNDTLFRYRIWNGSGSFSSSGSWTTAATRGSGNGPYSYPKPYRFSADTSGSVWLFKRRWTDGGGSTRSVSFRTSETLTGTSDPWSAYTDVLLDTGARPYVVSRTNGIDTIHFAASSDHPNESTFTTIRHFKGVLNGSNQFEWFDSAGTEIGASLPFGIASTTRIDDGGDRKRWVSDIAIGPGGHPWVLWMRYPNNNGTAIEYWVSVFDGSSWSAVKITDDGAGLYAGEQYYHGGLRFNPGDPTKVYLSAPVSGVRQVQEWRTADGGATWSSFRQITTGGIAGTPLKFRPVGVEHGDGRINLLWCQGDYDTFEIYSTALYAAG